MRRTVAALPHLRCHLKQHRLGKYAVFSWECWGCQHFYPSLRNFANNYFGDQSIPHHCVGLQVLKKRFIRCPVLSTKLVNLFPQKFLAPTMTKRRPEIVRRVLGAASSCVLLSKVSWTQALRQIVKNCYRYHSREDLLNGMPSDTPSRVHGNSRYDCYRSWRRHDNGFLSLAIGACLKQCNHLCETWKARRTSKILFLNSA